MQIMCQVLNRLTGSLKEEEEKEKTLLNRFFFYPQEVSEIKYISQR